MGIYSKSQLLLRPSYTLTPMSDVGDYVVVNPMENGAVEAEIYGPIIMCVEEHMRPPTQGVMLSDLVRGKHK